jgi:hypothetical protein
VRRIAFPVAEWIVNRHAPHILVVDLRSGRADVEFVLGVDADGPGAPDAARWLQPRLVR